MKVRHTIIAAALAVVTLSGMTVPLGGGSSEAAAAVHSVSARPSKSSRASTPFEKWLNSPTARKVSWRESNNRCHITNPTGKYQGKWQMDDNFWRAYGGRKYARNPHQATCHEQDLVAYRGWIKRGWKPWTTA